LGGLRQGIARRRRRRNMLGVLHEKLTDRYQWDIYVSECLTNSARSV
jgi:hypothetical protein